MFLLGLYSKECFKNFWIPSSLAIKFLLHFYVLLPLISLKTKSHEVLIKRNTCRPIYFNTLKIVYTVQERKKVLRTHDSNLVY